MQLHLVFFRGTTTDMSSHIHKNKKVGANDISEVYQMTEL